MKVKRSYPFRWVWGLLILLLIVLAYLLATHLYSAYNGLAFDENDNLYVGSVAGGRIYSVDKETGEKKTYAGRPRGGADDLVFGPDGRIYWTAFLLGKVYAMDRDGNISTLAEGLPGANSLDFTDAGELYVTQVFLGDALWKVDPSGEKKPVKLAEGLGGLNGFEFGTDGYLYGPLWFKGCIVKVDPENGTVVRTITDGLDTPAAVNFDSQGGLYAVDSGSGELLRIDIESGEKTRVAMLDERLDNLAISSDDRIFVTNRNTNTIYEIDPQSGEVRIVTRSPLSFTSLLILLSAAIALTIMSGIGMAMVHRQQIRTKEQT